MKTLKKKYFNMVEIALSIAIVTMGLMIVAALVPVCMKNSTNAKGSYYTSDISDSVNTFVSRSLASDFNLLGTIPETKPSASTSITNANNWTASGAGNIFNIPGADNGVFGIKMASGDQNDITDILGVIRVWRDRVGNVTIGSNETVVDMRSNALAGINVEVSTPLSKPYSQRSKHKFYFEVFNQDANTRNQCEEAFIEDLTVDPNAPAPIIEREDGEIVINENAKIKINIIASELCAGDRHAPVYVRVCVKEPGDTNSQGTIYNIFTGKKYLYDMPKDLTSNEYKQNGNKIKEIAAIPGNTWELEVPAGSTYKIWAGYYYRPNTYARYDQQGRQRGHIENDYWSTNKNQVLTLMHGDNPPEFSCDGLQLTPAQCITQYIDSNGLVTLAGTNEVLYLFELSHTSRNNIGFDMQDMIIKAEITEVSQVTANTNNGHGNNIDGVDVSNPGNSKEGLDTDPLIDDEKK